MEKIKSALNTAKYVILSALAIAGVILVAVFARKTPNASGQIRRDIEREQEAIRKRQARRRARLDDYPVEPRV
jgi:hypothetical protein